MPARSLTVIALALAAHGCANPVDGVATSPDGDTHSPVAVDATLPVAPAGTSSTAGTPSGGRLKVVLHDAPNPEVDEAWIAWDEVSVHRTDGDWTVLSNTPSEVDLLALQDGVATTLGIEDLEAGSYDQLRLHLTDAWVVVGDDEHPLRVPSGDTSGLKIAHGFTVPECGTLTLSLDWDVGAHLHRTGNDRYMLRPVIVVDDESVSGSCQRGLDASDADLVIYGERAGDGAWGAFPQAVGDLDGDGLDDVSIGIRRSDTVVGWPVHLWHGTLPATDTDNRSADARFGHPTGIALGWSSHGGVADLTGDGQRDLAMLLGRAPDQTTHNAVLYVVPGGAPYSGSPTLPGAAYSALYGEFSRVFTGGFDGDHDINGDGAADLVLAADGDLGGSGDGWTYIIHGPLPAGSSLASSLADVTLRDLEQTFGGEAARVRVADVNGDGVLDFVRSKVHQGTGYAGSLFTVLGPLTGHTNLPSGADSVVRGSVANAYFGLSLDVADLDGDGAAERIVGDMGDASRVGSVKIFASGNLASGAGDDVADLIIHGTAAGDNFGTHLAADDFDGDGCVDLAATATGAADPRVFVFRCPGSTGALSAADADIIIHVPGTGGPLRAIEAVGDVNGDGVRDLAIGARADDPARPTESNHGATLFFYGPL